MITAAAVRKNWGVIVVFFLGTVLCVFHENQQLSQIDEGMSRPNNPASGEPDHTMPHRSIDDGVVHSEYNQQDRNVQTPGFDLSWGDDRDGFDDPEEEKRVGGGETGIGQLSSPTPDITDRSSVVRDNYFIDPDPVVGPVVESVSEPEVSLNPSYKTDASRLVALLSLNSTDRDPWVATPAMLNELKMLRNRTLLVDGHLVPTVFLIGCQKCGSTSLYDAVNSHPNVFEGPQKEMQFFDREASQSKWKNLRTYISKYPAFAAQRVGTEQDYVGMDATVGYMLLPGTAQRMHGAFSPAVRARFRFVVVLRSPTDRLLSWYHHAKLQRYTKRAWVEWPQYADFDTFAQTILGTAAECSAGARSVWRDEECRDATFGLGSGHFEEQLRDWFNYFPQEQFLLLPFDVLVGNVPGDDQVAAALRFLNLDASQHKPLAHKMNGGGMLPMSGATRAALDAYYAPHNAALVAMLYDEMHFREGSFPPFL